MRWACVWGLLAGAAACASPEAAAPPQVEVAGCAEWRAGPVCEVGEAPLVLWVAGAPAAEVSLALDGRALAPDAAAAIQGGTRLSLRARAGTLALSVRGGAPWRLTLGAYAADAALAEVARLRRGGQAALAAERLAALGEHPGARREHARNELAAGRTAAALEALEAAIAEDRARGLRVAELQDRVALALTVIHSRGPVARVHAQLEALAPLAAEYAVAASDLDYVRTSLASEDRDVRAGLAHARRLIARAERLDLADPAVDARQMLTNLLVFAGRWPDAARELEALREAAGRAAGPCKAAQLWANIGWYRLLGHRQAPALFPAVPTAELDLAANLYGTACPRPVSAANAEINRSWGALFVRDLSTARARWRAARALVPEPSLRVRAHLVHLDAELSLAEGRADEALAAFDALGELGAGTGALDVRWQAAEGRGRALEARGRVDDAVDAYRAGEALLTALADRIPLGEGRDALLFDRARGAERGVSAAIAAGRLEEAIAMMRQSRRGALAWTRRLSEPVDGARVREVAAARSALDRAAAGAWAVPADRLADARAEAERERERTLAALDALFTAPRPAPAAVAAPSPDEAELFAHPGPRGLEVIVRRGGRMVAERDPRADALPALTRSAPLLAGARRVRVYAHPSVEGLDWMALSVAGAPLYTRAATVFAADVDGAPREGGPGRRALVIADPAQALPRAAREAAAVRDRLAAQGWTVAWLDGGDRASIARQLAAPLELLHYSGHGVQAGADGLDGGIPLAGQQRLTVLDVLTATAVPRRVVLAACDLGQRGSVPGAAGLGLAQAFVQAGAEAVVAASRPVDDVATVRWVERFYAHAAAQDWPEALRATTRELAGEVDAAAFRLWVP